MNKNASLPQDAPESLALHRRWLCLVCGALVFLMMGILYAWSLFVGPLEALYGWTRPDTSAIFTLTLLLFSLGNVVGGCTVSRWPLRNNILISAALICTGFVATSFARELWHVYVSYGVLCGFAIGFSYSSTLSYITRWFPDRPGVAAGVMLLSYGMSTVLFAAPILALIQYAGLHATLRVLAVIVTLVLVVAACLITAPPPGMVFPAPRATQDASPTTESTTQRQEFTSIQMLRHTSFHRFMLWQVLVITSAYAIIGHAATSASSIGASLALGAFATSLLAFSNGLSRLIWGVVTDRLGVMRMRLPIGVATLAGILLCLLAAYTSNTTILCIGFCMSGLAFGGSVAYTPLFIRYMYGERHFASNFSLFFLSSIFSSVIGPTITAYAYARYESYGPSFLILAIFICIGTAISFSIRKP